MAAIVPNYNGTATTCLHDSISATGTCHSDGDYTVTYCECDVDREGIADAFREDEFLIYLEEFFNAFCAWCDNKHSGLIYCLLYYEIRCLFIARIRSTAKAWKKQAGRYYAGLG